MIINNNSSQTIRCLIDADIEILLCPHETKQISVKNKEIIITLEHIYQSSYGDCFGWKDVCQIVINNEFCIQEVNSESVINISREKVHFELFYTYDRFFCSLINCKIASERSIVSGMDVLSLNVEHEVRKDTFLDRMLTFFLSGTCLLSTMLFFLFKIAFALNNWDFSWFYIFIFWLLGFAVQIIGEKVYYLFPQNKKSDQFRDLTKYVSEEAILQYYSNPNRNWVGHDIETE